MMPTTPTLIYEEQPLTDSDKEWLMTIYNLRRGDLIKNGYVRILFPFLVLMTLIGGATGLGSTDNWPLRMTLFIAVAFVITTVVWTIIYNSWAVPFRRDAESGIKLRKPFLITRKEFFYVTNQYFITLDVDPNNRIEVDADTYNDCEEGEYIYFFQAVVSKHIFYPNDHVRVKLFSLERGSRWDYSV
jgi:hypothetical protein